MPANSVAQPVSTYEEPRVARRLWRGSVPVAGAASRLEGRRYKRRRRLIALLFLLPAMAINLVVIGGPGVSSLYYAFTDWNGFTTPHFTGLANAERLIGDADFWNAIGHNFIYMI